MVTSNKGHKLSTMQHFIQNWWKIHKRNQTSQTSIGEAK